MIPLTASTAALLARAKRDTSVIVISDSSTVTRIAKNKDSLETTSGGWGLTADTPIRVTMKAKDEIWAISAGTPNITVFEDEDDFQPVVA